MTTHLLKCKECDYIFEHNMPITEAGEGNWPPCPECGSAVRKIWQPNQVRYLAEGYSQRDRINEENRPRPGTYEPLG